LQQVRPLSQSIGHWYSRIFRAEAAFVRMTEQATVGATLHDSTLVARKMCATFGTRWIPQVKNRHLSWSGTRWADDSFDFSITCIQPKLSEWCSSMPNTKTGCSSA
jgi:hypothetical protein